MDSPPKYNYGKKGNYIREGCVKTIRYIFQYALDNQITRMFFLGDIHALKDKLPNKLKNPLIDLFEEFNDVAYKFIIVGNHDRYNEELAIKYLKPYAEVIQDVEIDSSFGTSIVMVPCLSNIRDIIKTLKGYQIDLLLGHFFIKESLAGRFSDNSVPLEMLDNCRTVIVGHDHEFQRLAQDIYVLGSIYQEDWGEADQSKFICVYEKGKTEFIEIPLFINRKDIALNSNLDIDEHMAYKPRIEEGLFYMARLICNKPIDTALLNSYKRFLLDEGYVRVDVIPYIAQMQKGTMMKGMRSDFMVQDMIERSLTDIKGMHKKFICHKVIREIERGL